MPDFSRRALLGIAPAILCVPREQLVLEAIAAERMPHQLLVSGVARANFFELRNYGVSQERLIEATEKLERTASFGRGSASALWVHNHLQSRDHRERSTPRRFSHPLVVILNRHGIWPALEDNGRFLFPFESLAARERAWREVSADAEWIALAPRLSEIAIYKASSYR